MHDFIVIGAGMAGASVAAELSRMGTVRMLEMEAQPGYHSTGRSAALYEPNYGPPAIRALTRASGPFFRDPPAGFADVPLVTPRNMMVIARSDQLDALEAQITEAAAHGPVERLNAAEARAEMPLLREGYAAAAMLDRVGADIDVDALLQGFLRAFRARGGTVETKAPVTAMTRQDGVWTVETPKGRFRAPVVINAAGAWADHIGALAGAERIGLQPKRRTALTIAAPEGMEIDAWPMVVDAVEDFYLKPDAGRLLISPANADPVEPQDVQPEELDIAICIDHIERAFDLSVRRIESRWAGLRSFVADGTPVVGLSGKADGFLWLAGQGGYGIQTAPALSRFAAALATGAPTPEDIAAQGLSPDDLSPLRLAHA
ncbi:NAD(P)/FAD-dependent oxidoreductase [Chachezhania antarctica]|uniref:NAD(P)/FAD-dependent oxidoreductase n=1 Tax=Chachezhania antarctica TaxID=2340860 RepID=UPI000EABCF83|nr:FAD-dependent oxidoreductase [Chachezhania antarctica]